MNLYIHVPFCAQRCSYCDFYTQTNLRLRSAYLSALIRELEMRRAQLPHGDSIKHLYFGGGTPSLLSPGELQQVIDAIRQLYPLSAGGEWTIECNPDDITRDYAEALRGVGFNRVSMGVQSFQESDLQFLNRRHSAQQVYSAVDDLHSAGFDNLSLDLIYGLPGQTEASLQDNLSRILSLQVPHISAYHLIYEEGTPLTRMRDRGMVSEVSEDESLRLLELLTETLTRAGYEHYEVSNFALPGCYAQLNTGYWMGEPYLGLGPSAHSFDGLSTRSDNVASIRDYTTSILEQGVLPQSTEHLSPTDLRHEMLMVRLRTQWGLPLGVYTARFGQAETERLLGQAKPYLVDGRLSLEGDTLRITRRGLFVSDAIILALWD